jgi:hypothetical protein
MKNKYLILLFLLSFCNSIATAQSNGRRLAPSNSSANFAKSLVLRNVSFSGTGLINIARGERGSNSTAMTFYSVPQYITNLTKNPVAYASGSKPVIRGEFNVTCSPPVFVKAKLSNGFTLPTKEISIQNGIGVYESPTNESFALNKVDLVDDMTVTWSYTKTPNGSWIEVDQKSVNDVYVTSKKPLKIFSPLNVYTYPPEFANGQATFLTYLELSCRNAKGKTSQTDIVNGIYNGVFRTGDITLSNGTTLTYWGGRRTGSPYASVNLDPFTLLATGEGRCHSFVYLFIDLLKTQGLGDGNGTCVAQPLLTQWQQNLDAMPNTYQTQLQFDIIGEGYSTNYSSYAPLEGAKVKPYFFVKNWNKRPGTYIVEPLRATNSVYQVGMSISDSDDLGINGQNNNNPWSLFNNHVLVQFEGKIYDPSYGSPMYNDFNTWKKNNVAAVGTVVLGYERDVQPIRTLPVVWLCKEPIENIPFYTVISPY